MEEFLKLDINKNDKSYVGTSLNASCIPPDVRYEDTRSFSRRVQASTLAFFRELAFLFYSAWVVVSYYCGRIVSVVTGSIQKEKATQWKKNSEGLVVFIHGLFGSPLVWKQHMEFLGTQVDSIAPCVYKRGNCSLKKATEGILRIIKSYKKQHPDKPICIVSMSNGVRIALEAYCEMMGSCSSKNFPKVHLSSVAGALSGSPNIDFLKRWFSFITPWILHPDVLEELAHHSPSSKELLRRFTIALRSAEPVEGALPAIFFGTPEDVVLRDVNSAFPIVPKELENRVEKIMVEGEGHRSLVQRIMQIQMKICLRWIRAHQTVKA